MDDIVRKAVSVCREDTLDEAQEFGCLPPSMQVSPLDNGGYTVEEYSMMERDRGKYLLYMAALQMAVSELVSRKPGVTVRVAVVGCGRGRLIQFGPFPSIAQQISFHIPSSL